MKALTVKQPWATLIIAGGKDVENRTRRTHYRGPLAIHVSQSVSSLTDTKNQSALGHLSPELLHLALLATSKTYSHRGCVIGTVDLVDCVQDSSSPWAFPDHWHWVLANPQPFTEAIPAKGRLGIWEWEP